MKLGIPERLKSNPLAYYSGVLLATGLISNVLGYLFQVYVGRALGPAGYGVYSSIISVLYILSIPSQTIQTSIARFVSIFNRASEKEKIASLLFASLKKLAKAGIIGLLLIVLLSGSIASFLRISEPLPVALLGVLFFLGLMTPVVGGALQGVQRFWQMALAGIGGSVLKLAFAVFLISFGFGVSGAILALALAGAGGFLLYVFFLREFIGLKKTKVDVGSIYAYSLPVLLTAVLLTVMSNADMILVKRYLDPLQAGYYAAVSLLGKVVFFASGPIVTVMFPKVSEVPQNPGNHRFLRDSFLYVGGISAILVAAYFTAPGFIVKSLFGSRFLDAAEYIGYMGIAIAFFSLLNLMVFYNLARGRTKFLYVLSAGTILEILFIAIYHPDLLAVIKILVAVMGMSLATMVFISRREVLGDGMVVGQ